MKINVLDCTLRDGGYVNNWAFSRAQIIKIIQSLEKSNVEIIELGYLNDKEGLDVNTTLFNSLDAIDVIVNDSGVKVKMVVMIDLFAFDINKLPHRSKTKIDGIRLAFHKKDLDKAVILSKKIINLGYQLFFQPMVTKNYNSDEFTFLIEKVNTLDVYAFYVVDSFGSMTLNEFREYISVANDNLNVNIKLGYHSHNNMQLAFSNTVDLCANGIDREVILDGSIYGMGRGAGNLNTELIIDYLNNNNGKNYRITPLLEVIDEILTFYFKKYPWGFSPTQYLSASLDCHPSYASYLVNKKTNHIADIHKILDKIPLEFRSIFDEKIVNDLYQKFLLTNNSKPQGRLDIPKDKKILLIASGYSINDNLEKIKQKIESNEYFTIALNHKPKLKCDYYFFSNQQRFDEFKKNLPSEKKIITSNISCNGGAKVVINLKDIVDTTFVTNSAILMINNLVLDGIKSVEIAGLDGYKKGKNNYTYNETNVASNENLFAELNKIISDALMKLKHKIIIELITPSIYSKDINKDISLRIMGVIPARYDSSRFPGKPLCLINNIPMIKRTYNQVKKSKLLDKLVVATDSLKIKEYCEKEGIPVVMTSDKHLTGTDRLAEVAQKEYYDLYINIQGDEPVIDYHSINQIVNDYRKNHQIYDVYNLYKKTTDRKEIEVDTIIKVVVNQYDELMYMSRHPIPFNKSKSSVIHNTQVCVYGFTKKALGIFSNRGKTQNEQFEDIEMLRFVDLGCPVKMIETTVDSIAVDVPEDIKKVEDFLNRNHLL